MPFKPSTFLERGKLKKLALLIASFVILHLLIINVPSDYVFDEYWYVPSAKSALYDLLNKPTRVSYEGVEKRPEHPPLAQLFIALGILLFGDEPLGWRVFSVVFGASAILAVYAFARELSGSEETAFTAAALLSIDKMFFTFSSLALLDVFFVAFMVWSFLLYFKGKAAPSAVLMGLSAACKLTALFSIPALMLYEVFRWRPGRRARSIERKKILVWLGVFALSFLASLYAFDRLYAPAGERPYQNPIAHLAYMVSVHGSRNWPREPRGDPPWLWLLNPGNYYLGGVSALAALRFEAYNPLLMGLPFLSLPYCARLYLKEGDRLALAALLWFSVTYFPWFPLYFALARPIFSFYLLPAIPPICVANSMLFKGSSRASRAYLIATSMFFLIFQYPVKAVPPLG